MKFSRLVITAIVLSLSACSQKEEYQEFDNAEAVGREIMEAIRTGRSDFLAGKLSPASPYHSDTEEISRTLAEMVATCGNLEKPALFDVKALSDEDFEPGETPVKGAVQVYAAMLTDRSGSSDAAGVDINVRMVPAQGGRFQLMDWEYIPIFEE